MSTSVLSTARESTARESNGILSRFADYLELTKPKIVVLELIVAAAAACLAMPRGLDPTAVMHALFGTALVASSASIVNPVVGTSQRCSDATHR